MSYSTIAAEIAALKIVLNWATTENHPDGRPLLPANPIGRVRVRTGEPRRPVAGDDRYRALKGVSASLSPLLDLALDLAYGTGHRIGAILGLRQQHLLLDASVAAATANEVDPTFGWKPDDFPFGGIHWYAERHINTKVAPHVTPITQGVMWALEKARRGCPAIGGAWVFPSPRDPTQPMSRYVLDRLLRQAERLAGQAHLPGGAWHPFRRGWATAHKHAPDVDVAKLGGWRDVATMKKCYTRPDTGTIRAIVASG